jgi:nucleotide-binding universal stress UspA family protein
MTYATLMVHLELGRSNANVLNVVGDLAARFNAGVIGIAACQSMPMVYGEGYVSAELIEQDLLGMQRELQKAEAELRDVLAGRVATLEWRSTAMFASISDYLAREARSADLVVTGTGQGDLFDASRALNVGDLLMNAGRPVLIVPAAVATLQPNSVVVAWKDTREARRAVCDALPLLRVAHEVCVVEVVAEGDAPSARLRVADVAAWLQRHGVQATSLAAHSAADNATTLYSVAQERLADVIVAGAYGHSRLREWALGGMTRDLVNPTQRCSLVSH